MNMNNSNFFFQFKNRTKEFNSSLLMPGSPATQPKGRESGK